jgi:uncharacterized cupin superfamily protein
MAEIVSTDTGDVPRGEGWYVLNARRARWQHSPGFGGSDLSFQGDVRFPDVGVHLGVLQPGEPTGMYHDEPNQEGFLVLQGRCLAIVEGREVELEAWDYFHCPAGTPHILVGAGDGPCLVIGLGSRQRGGGTYLRDETALRHGASVERDTTDPAEAYAGTPDFHDGPAPPLP